MITLPFFFTTPHLLRSNNMSIIPISKQFNFSFPITPHHQHYHLHGTYLSITCERTHIISSQTKLASMMRLTTSTIRRWRHTITPRHFSNISNTNRIVRAKPFAFFFSLVNNDLSLSLYLKATPHDDDDDTRTDAYHGDTSIDER